MSKKVKPKNVPPVFLVKILKGFTDFLRNLRRKILPPEFIISEYIIEYLVIQRLVFAVTELWIPNLLEDGPQSIEELAKKAGVNCNALYRVMRALTGAGIFKEKKGRVFENTKLSKCLMSGGKGTMAALTKYTGSTWIVKDWADILFSMDKGQDIYQVKYGKRYFEWIEENPEEYRIFDEGMLNLSQLSDDPITAVYNFSKMNSIVDIGAGHGTQLASILKANPHMKGVHFDLERVVLAAKQEDPLNDPLVKDRVEYAVGDFFKSVPEGHDAYFMKSILHDWSNEEAIRILQTCRKAMHEKSRLLVTDMVVKADNKPYFGDLMDCGMLVLLGGQERTEEEFANVFEKSGFKLTRFIPTASPYFIVEGVPI